MIQPLFDLTGKKAFITGATKGIGRAIVEAFVEHGATVVITSRKGDEAQAAASEVNARNGRDAALGLQADLADLQGTIASYDEAISRLGQIDILVCNAAATVHQFGSAPAFSVEDSLRLMQVNVVHNVELMNYAATAMKARRDGVLLVTSSASGIRPSYGVFPYGVSKAGLNHAVRSLAIELAQYNVRVNGIAPGLTRSWSLEQQAKKDPKALERFARDIPLRRITEAEEIAAGMVFLASAGGRAMTGQMIAMDGGEPGVHVPEGV